MRVLVAEDSTLIQQVLKTAVEDLGHECLVASNGLEAYRLFSAQSADVIISDWNMPELGGHELCRRVRADPRDGYTYFVFLTAFGAEHNLLGAMRAGADDFLTKPLQRVALEARLIAAERVTSLHRERQASLAQLKTLLRASRRFAFEAQPELLLPDILREAIDLLGANEGEIACWDEREGRFAQIHRISADGGRRSLHELADDSGRTDQVASVVSFESAADDRGPAVISASMLHNRQLLGTIRLFCADPAKRFDQTDVEVLELLAGVAAATLVGTERSRLEGVLLAGRTMSHELNNKLAVTVGNVDLIASDPRLPADLEEQAQLAIEAAQEASQILAQLVQLARIREVSWGAFTPTTIDLKGSVSAEES
jgi:DNA-binding response OmpR family regulator